MKNQGCRALGRPKKPLLSTKQRAARLKFAKAFEHLTAEDWEDFLFSDECPKYLFQLPNPKNDIVWGSQDDKVPPSYQVKNSSKWMIWGGMTGQGLTALHFVPQERTVTADYYIENIFKKEVKPLLRRRSTTEAVDKRNCSALTSRWHWYRTEQQPTRQRLPKHGAVKTCGISSLRLNGQPIRQISTL